MQDASKIKTYRVKLIAVLFVWLSWGWIAAA